MKFVQNCSIIVENDPFFVMLHHLVNHLSVSKTLKELRKTCSIYEDAKEHTTEGFFIESVFVNHHQYQVTDLGFPTRNMRRDGMVNLSWHNMASYQDMNLCPPWGKTENTSWRFLDYIPRKMKRFTDLLCICFYSVLWLTTLHTSTGEKQTNTHSWSYSLYLARLIKQLCNSTDRLRKMLQLKWNKADLRSVDRVADWVESLTPIRKLRKAQMIKRST